jgi:uncharacterized protein
VTRYLCDANVWLALALSEHVHQPIASDWLATVDEPGSVFFSRSTQQALLRLLTNHTVLGAYGNKPLTNHDAWAVYEAIARDDRVGIVAHEPPGLETRWRDLAVADSASPKLWMDAYLAAFALGSGMRLVTLDAGFQQFPDLDLLLLR